MAWAAIYFSSAPQLQQKEKTACYVGRLSELPIPGCFHPSLELFCVTSIMLHTAVALFFYKYHKYVLTEVIHLLNADEMSNTADY